MLCHYHGVLHACTCIQIDAYRKGPADYLNLSGRWGDLGTRLTSDSLTQLSGLAHPCCCESTNSSLDDTFPAKYKSWAARLLDKKAQKLNCALSCLFLQLYITHRAGIFRVLTFNKI